MASFPLPESLKVRKPIVAKILNLTNNMYHWKQTSYNQYKLIGPGTNLFFDTYEKLYSYCQKNHINAQQN